MKSIRDLERLFKAAANRRRLQIFRVLHSNGELPVGVIAERIGISFTSTSRHLVIMERAGILDKEQRSTEVYYQIASAVPRDLKALLS